MICYTRLIFNFLLLKSVHEKSFSVQLVPRLAWINVKLSKAVANLLIFSAAVNHDAKAAVFEHGLGEMPYRSIAYEYTAATLQKTSAIVTCRIEALVLKIIKYFAVHVHRRRTFVSQEIAQILHNLEGKNTNFNFLNYVLNTVINHP